MWTDLSAEFRLLHVVQNAEVNPAACERFFADLEEALRLVKTDRLSTNYTAENIDLSGHQMFDALYDQHGNFVACAGIYRRESWPAGAFRLLNRTFYSPAFRRPERFQFLGSDWILPYQVKHCEIEMPLTFVSREGRNAHFSLAQISKRSVFAPDYRISDTFIQVVPGIFDRHSFQKILYRKLNPEQTFEFTAANSLKDAESHIVHSVFL